ncbi:MAG: CPBP family intramembrane metalloprotease, partial [Candidatus Thorarchaeota archaeon]|nr:CPBP family intramembrane metalloprotease [Candidatus Thorarchaeota archaeon]
ALFHVPGILYYTLPPVSSALMFVNLLLGGVMLGLAFAQTRNLWLPIGLHFGWNFMLY